MNQRATIIQKLKAAAFGAAVILTASQAAQAQPAAGRFTYSAPKGISYTASGVRLEGFAGKPSRVQLPPQLDVSALVIGVDLHGNDIQQVRAVTGVNFKVNLAPRGGTSARIEATCDNATLDPKTRVLVLTGGVDGFYQIGDGPRNTLKTKRATLRYVNNNLNVKVEGGARLEVSGSDFGRPEVGKIAINATRGTLDQASGIGRFTGNARAVSSGGTNAFDVAASEFIVTRSASGTIDNLKTNGRTKIKIDLPPEPAAANALSPSSAPSAPSGIVGNLGRPTRVEVTADSATLTGENQTLILEGNVVGSYVLAPPNAPPATYNFSGERAVLRFLNQAEGAIPAGLNVNVTGAPNKPVEMQTPSFNLGL